MSARHLLRQGKQCKDDTEDKCLYLDENGMACAAGVFLTDEGAQAADNPKEKLGHICSSAAWQHLIDLGAVPDVNCLLITALQNVHDYTSVHTWRDNLRRTAKDFNLNDAVCRESL
jgi:hypothetical protein